MSADKNTLSAKDVQDIAHLARLKIDENEIPKTAQNLSSIVDFVGQLDAAVVDGGEPMAHPLDLVQRLRPDEVTETDKREQYQACAPEVAEGMYLVPKVID